MYTKKVPLTALLSVSQSYVIKCFCDIEKLAVYNDGLIKGRTL